MLLLKLRFRSNELYILQNKLNQSEILKEENNKLEKLTLFSLVLNKHADAINI